jgi:hypothetical protein
MSPWRKCSRGSSSSSSCNWVDRQVSLEPGGIPRVRRGPVLGWHLGICVNSCNRIRNFKVWLMKEIIIIIQVFFAHALLQCKHQTSEHKVSWSLFPFGDARPLWILQTDFRLPCPFHYYYLYYKSYKGITNDEKSLYFAHLLEIVVLTIDQIPKDQLQKPYTHC